MKKTKATAVKAEAQKSDNLAVSLKDIFKAMKSYPTYATGKKNLLHTTEDGRVGILTYAQMYELYRRNALVRMVVDTKMKVIINLDWALRPKQEGMKISQEAIQREKDFFSYPNDQDSWYAFGMKSLKDLFIIDSLAVEVEKVGETVTALWPVNASTIRPVMDEHGRLKSYKQVIPRAFSDTGEQKTANFSRDELIYCHEYPSNQSEYGLTPIETLVLEIGTDICQMDYSAHYFQEGYLFSKILLLSDLGESDLERLNEMLTQKKGERYELPILSTKEGKGAMLDMGINNNTMQTSAMWEWLFKRIAGAYQLTPSEVMELKSFSTKASAEQQSRISEHKAFRPIISILQYEINKWVMPGRNPDLVWEMDPERLSEEQKVKILGDKVKAGIPYNEARQQDGQKPVEFEMDWHGQSINPFELPFSDLYLRGGGQFGLMGDEGSDIQLTAPRHVRKDQDGAEAKAQQKEQIRRALRRLLGHRAAEVKARARVDTFKGKLKPAINKLVAETLRLVTSYAPAEKSWRFTAPENLKLKAREPNPTWVDVLINRAFENSEFEQNVEQVMEKNLTRTLKQSASRIYDGISASLSVSFKDEYINQWVKEYFRDRFYNKGVLASLTETQKAQISRILTEQYKEGATVTDYIDSLQTYFDGLKDWQVERIARTEDFLADTHAERKIWRDFGVQLYDFVVAPGACGLCLAMANGGTPAQYDAKYSGSAADFNFPGSPYTEKSMDEVTGRAGFSDGLPHPNCEDAWTASADISDSQMDEIVDNISRAAEKFK